MLKLKIIINIVTLVALAWLVYTFRLQLTDALVYLQNLSWWLFLLHIPCQCLVMVTTGAFYYSFFKNIKESGSLTFSDACKTSLEMYFVNNILPSGGAVGFSYLGLRLRPFGIRFATSTLVHSMRFVLTFLGFLLLLGPGLLILAADDKANDLALVIGRDIFFLTLVGAAIFVFLISSRQRIHGFVVWLPKVINQIAQRLPKVPTEIIQISKVERVLGEIHKGYRYLSRNPSALRAPALYALATNIFDVLAIYFLFLAFGVPVNIGAVILAYAVANFTGLIVFLPGNIGPYEALMVAVLLLAGVENQAAAISVTLLFRVSKVVLFIPLGYICYHKAVSQYIKHRELLRRSKRKRSFKKSKIAKKKT